MLILRLSKSSLIPCGSQERVDQLKQSGTNNKINFIGSVLFALTESMSSGLKAVEHSLRTVNWTD